jgi:hypothetical protein
MTMTRKMMMMMMIIIIIIIISLSTATCWPSVKPQSLLSDGYQKFRPHDKNGLSVILNIRRTIAFKAASSPVPLAYTTCQKLCIPACYMQKQSTVTVFADYTLHCPKRVTCFGFFHKAFIRYKHKKYNSKISVLYAITFQMRSFQLRLRGCS